VTFRREGEKVRVTARASGLRPGPHGFHIHQRGVCQAPDFSSAGDHFDPEGHPHGAPGGKTHAGDLGNLEAGADGTAVYSATLSADRVSLEPGPRSLQGRAVVVHERPDDLRTQPTGGSGARLACGVIRPVP
jgi:Cu-Zn family superoxide dismutase